ncbi:MAG: hypothetical protein JKY09_02280 [Crocinitomicaceae bacterium]|nr:hypothetical protein [Crocinitomicaceae bacterium]
MKKLIYTLFVLVGLSSFSFAQENDLAITNGATELAVSKVSGIYVFTLPDNVTKEDVAKNAKYYTHYFSVEFKDHKATIKMTNNNAKDRYVIARFLTACKVRHIQVDDDSLELYDFIEKHLK